MNNGLKSFTKQIILSIDGLVDTYVNINKSDANFHIVVPLIKSIGLCPIDLKLIYNLRDNNYKTDFGKGFKLNYYSYINGGEYSDVSVTNPDGSKDSYLVSENYYNKDTKLTCKVVENDDTYFEFKDKIGNIFSYWSNYNEGYPTEFIFKTNDKISFDVSNSLIKISNNHQDIMKLNKDNKGNVTLISYYHNNVLLNSIEINYDTNSYISKIIYKNGNTITNSFSFSFNINFIEIIDDITGRRFKFLIENSRVITIKEGFNVAYNYSKDINISYFNRYSVITDYKGKKSYCFFDNNNLLDFEFNDDGILNRVKYNNDKLLIFNSESINTKKINNLLNDNDLNNFNKSGNLTLTKYNLNDPIFNSLIKGNVYKIIGNGKLTKTFNINTIGLDNILAFIYGKVISNIDDNNYVEVSLSVDNVDYDRFKISNNDNFELLSLADTVFNSGDSITITIRFIGNNEIILGGLELFYKEVINYNYDNNHNLISTGNKIKGSNFKYNDNELIKEDTSISNNSNSYSYDENGNVEYIYSPYEVFIINEYDKTYKSNLKQTTKVNDFNGEYIFEKYTYSSDGRFLLSINDGFNNIETYNSYDNYGRILKYTDKLNIISNYQYNNDGSINKYIINKDNNSSNIIYNYDNKKRISKITLSNGSYYNYIYDSYDNLIEIKLNNVTIYKNEYDLVNNNLTKISYGNNSDGYYFNYDNDNKLIKIDYLDNNNEIKRSYEYIYNEFNELIKIKDNFNNIYNEFEYDFDGKLTLLKGNNYSINYKYNNLNNVNSKKINIRNKELNFAYSYVNDSAGSNPNSLKEAFKDINGFIGIYQTDLNLIRHDEIVAPIEGMQHDSISLEGESIRYALINTTHGLTYRIRHSSKNKFPVGNISFWFKISYFNDRLSKHYLFSIKQVENSSNHSKISIYMYENRLHLELTDFNGVTRDVLTFSKPINFYEWNFFSLNYYNRDDGIGYDDVSRYELFINNDKEVFEQINPRLCLDLADLFEIKFGFDLDDTIQISDEIKLSSLLIAHNENITVDDIYKFYRYTKDYLIDNQLVENDIKTVNFSSTNLYQISEDAKPRNYKIYPLNNSLNSLDGNRPIVFDTKEISYLDKDRIFNFNQKNKRYSYITDGNKLIYDFNLSNVGSVGMNLYLDGYHNKQYILEAIDSNDKNISIYRDLSKKVIINISNKIINSNLVLEDDKWVNFVFSYEVVNIDNNINKKVNIRLVVGDNTFETEVLISSYFTNLKFMIGRQYETSLEDSIFGEYIASNPLCGQIEMLIVSSEYLDLITMRKLYFNVGSIDKIKQFDSFSMLKKEEINNYGTNLITKTYKYKEKNKVISNFIKQEIIKIENQTITRNYETDAYGRVTKIIDSIFGNHTYEYDYRGFLIKEDNKTYSYDKNGNIILKDGVSLSYDTTIKDRLISIGEDTITYNSANVLLPNTYRNNRLIFEGKRLIRFITNSEHFDYEYNDAGIRTRKVNTYGLGHNFIYEGNKLINDKTNDYELDFLYDENDILYGFIKDKKSIYYYIRDVLGNILGITDSFGALIVKYNLDAFGKLISITGSSANTIGKINPFRYKGYYYDEETHFYYLISRYYDPETGRFISPDSIDYLDPSSINELNLYCYCGNDPINHADPSGYAWYNPLTWDWGEIAKGAGLFISGVAAIAVGAVTLPYGGWIAAVAGVTIFAGGGTALFGLSDFGEGITDYNVIQESVFIGNEEAYNLTENIFKYTAIAGTVICGIYGATHTTLSASRRTLRTGNAHSAVYNKQFNTLTYYGKNGQMKYSMHLFCKDHQWVHWHTELPHSQPINNFLKFIWEMTKRGF